MVPTPSNAYPKIFLYLHNLASQAFLYVIEANAYSEAQSLMAVWRLDKLEVQDALKCFSTLLHLIIFKLLHRAFREALPIES